jgi:DNA transformation protein and related proteins
MPVSEGFTAFVLAQLDAIGPIATKPMFGAVALYAGDLFFGLIAGDVLYLKVDGATRAARERAGARAFVPYPSRPGTPSTKHFSVPAAILEDDDQLMAWARESIQIARAGRRDPPSRKAPATRGRRR